MSSSSIRGDRIVPMTWYMVPGYRTRKMENKKESRKYRYKVGLPNCVIVFSFSFIGITSMGGVKMTA